MDVDEQSAWEYGLLRFFCEIFCSWMLRCSTLCLFVQLRTLMHYFT